MEKVVKSERENTAQREGKMSQTVTIMGQGYVGLPLAQAATNAGLRVHGLDISESIVDALNEGNSHIDDLTHEDIQEMLDSGYRATTDQAVISESNVIVVCVPTPLGSGGSPELGPVKSAMRMIGSNLTPGATVILESTTYPGTTDDVCIPILEEESGLTAGEEFYVAYSPERVDPGRIDYGIRNTPKLVGGHTEAATQRATDFYTTFVDTVVPLSGTREAETSKLLENTFRHVNIALVNEMAKFCHELGIDIWEVIRGASTKPFGFMQFTPGPGVGGHCIPIDPNYLSYEVRRQLGYPFRFVELAQEINNSMPRYVTTRASQLLNKDAKAIRGSCILLIGVTYKPNIADQRESPALPLAELLIEHGASVQFHDPFVEEWHLENTTLQVEPSLNDALSRADLVIILQNHTSYDLEAIIKRSRRVLDTRGTAPAPADRL